MSKYPITTGLFKCYKGELLRWKFLLKLCIFAVLWGVGLFITMALPKLMAPEQCHVDALNVDWRWLLLAFMLFTTIGAVVVVYIGWWLLYPATIALDLFKVNLSKATISERRSNIFSTLFTIFIILAASYTLWNMYKDYFCIN